MRGCSGHSLLLLSVILTLCFAGTCSPPMFVICDTTCVQNADNAGEKGINISSTVYTGNQKYVELELVCSFFDRFGQPLQAVSSSFSNDSGQAAVISYLTPTRKNEVFADCSQFIPYTSLPYLSQGETYRYQILLRQKEDHYMVLADSGMQEFTVAESPQSATVDRVWVEYGATKDGFDGVNLHASLQLKGEKDKLVEIIYSVCTGADQPVRTKMKSYSSPDGSVQTSTTVVPDSDRSSMDDVVAFLPFASMPEPENNVNYYVTASVLAPEGKLAVSNLEPFPWAPSQDENVTLDWLSPKTGITAKNYKLSVGIKATGKISDVQVYVNGQNYRGMKVVSNDGYDMVINQDVTLRDGDNNVRLEIKSATGVKTVEEYLNCNLEDRVASQDGSQKRLALVIGNAHYESQPLANPTNDANDVAAKLKTLGFDVQTVIDGDLQTMNNAINTFGEKSRSYDVALFYYAGHGVQYNGVNYLIPIHAEMASEADIQYNCACANRILAKLEESKCPMNIIVLDACRNNPFERSWHRGVENQGLANMNAPKGTFIAYSTSPGSVAQDGSGRNSPYSTAFLRALDKPGLGIFDFFQEVSTGVMNSTGDAQVPWTASSFVGKFYFNRK